MSKKKGTTLSLAEFAGDAYESTLLPTESKGIERLDSSRPPRASDRGDRTWGDRGDRSERPSGGDRGERVWGDRPPRPSRTEESEEGSFRSSRPPRTDDASRADEITDWRGGDRTLRTADSSLGRSSFSRGRDTSDSNPGDEGKSWRDGPRKEPTITPTSSFGRFGDRSDRFERSERDSSRRYQDNDSTPEDWRDKLSRSSSSQGASSGAWVPRHKQGVASTTTSALAPVSEKPEVSSKSSTLAAPPISWGEEEDEIVVLAPSVDEEKLRGFVERFGLLLGDDSKKFDTFAKRAAENFTASELETCIPLKKAAAIVFEAVAELKDEEEVVAVLQRCGVVFQQMQLTMKDNEFEVNVLVLFQKLAHSRNCPRLSPQCTLIEAIWLGLYEAQVVSEEAVRMWMDSSHIDYMLEKDETVGDFSRTTILFQTQALRQWLLEDQDNKAKKTGWGSDEEEEDVDAELQSYLSQTISRSKGAVSIKKTISASAARR